MLERLETHNDCVVQVTWLVVFHRVAFLLMMMMMMKSYYLLAVLVVFVHVVAVVAVVVVVVVVVVRVCRSLASQVPMVATSPHLPRLIKSLGIGPKSSIKSAR